MDDPSVGPKEIRSSLTVGVDQNGPDQRRHQSRENWAHARRKVYAQTRLVHNRREGAKYTLDQGEMYVVVVSVEERAAEYTLGDETPGRELVDAWRPLQTCRRTYAWGRC